MFQGQVNFTFSSVHFYYGIKSSSVSASVIYYCWKLWLKKCWIEFEVNRGRELSVESDIPPKINENWRHTSCLDRWRSPVIRSNKRFYSKENVCRGRLAKHKWQIRKHSWNLCEIYPNRQAVKNVHIQQTSSLEKELHLKSNRFEKTSKSFGCRTPKWTR